MPSGEMRRPPQPWESKLARLTSIVAGAGIRSSDGGTSPVTPTPPPGAGGGTEPAPVLPPPGRFIKPSTPTVLGSVQGVNVLWDGLNSSGELWPYDTSWVEVHMATSGTGFTPGTATLKGRLARPGAFFVGGLTAGTPYYFRLRGADPAGNYTEASDAATGYTGLTTSSDYGTATIGTGSVSFNARQIGGVTSTVGTATPSSPVVGDLWLDTTGGATTHKRWNGTTWEVTLFGSGSIADLAITEVKIDNSAITAAKIAGSAITETKIAPDAVTSPKIVAGAVVAAKIAAGAVETDKLAANAVTAAKIAANTITASQIAANTITASQIAANTITSSQLAANSVTATQIAAGAVTAGAIAAGAVTTDKLTAGTITGFRINGGTISGGYISGGTMSAGYISGGTISGALVQSSSGNSRIALTSGDSLDFYNSGSSQGSIKARFDGLDLFFNNYYFVNKNNTGYAPVTTATLNCSAIDDTGSASLSYSGVNRAFRVAATGEVYSYGIDDNTTASAANVRIGTSAQLLKSTSSVRRKSDLAPIDDDLAGVSADKLSSQPASVNPYDVLALTPTEFQSLSAADAEARAFGFIAEDVAEKFPWACDWDNDGLPDSVQDRPIVAALVQVVKDLTARIDALEGN